MKSVKSPLPTSPISLFSQPSHLKKFPDYIQKTTTLIPKPSTQKNSPKNTTQKTHQKKHKIMNIIVPASNKFFNSLLNQIEKTHDSHNYQETHLEIEELSPISISIESFCRNDYGSNWYNNDLTVIKKPKNFKEILESL